MNQIGQYIEFMKKQKSPISIDEIMDHFQCDEKRAKRLAVVAKNNHGASIRKVIYYEMVECPEGSYRAIDAKADILQILQACHEDEFTAFELAAQLEKGIRHIRGFLNQLESQGLVKNRLEGTLKYWSCV